MRPVSTTLQGAVLAVFPLALLMAFLPLAALAQSTDAIAESLEFRHYFIDEGAPVSVNEMEELVESHAGFYFVALDETPGEGADALAAELLDQVGSGTVVVLTSGEVGAVSSEYDDTSLSGALDVMVAQEDSFADEFGQVATALTEVVVTTPEAGSPSEGGGVPWLAIIGVGLVALIGFTIWRSGRRQKEAVARHLEEARVEIRQQMDVIADQIVKLADDPRTEGKPQALNHYRSASETFSQAETRLAAATSLAELEDLSDDLDRARWDLEASTALMEGRQPPPAPVDEKPEHCFFDPTHGAGVEDAELKTPAGTRKVMVCKVDAEKLRRGEAPVPRDLPMGPQRVPAPQAPRSAGGSGLDWLDVFSVIVGGMGQGVPYNWPRQNTRSARRSSGGGLGIPFPGRSSSRSSSSNRSGSSSRSSGSGSGTGRPKGRARRTR